MYKSISLVKGLGYPSFTWIVIVQVANVTAIQGHVTDIGRGKFRIKIIDRFIGFHDRLERGRNLFT